MNGQRHSDNQGPEWMAVHWSTHQTEINHCIHNLGWQGLHPHLLTIKVNFPHNLLLCERPRFNLNCIYGWVTWKRGKNPDHMTSPWGEGMLGNCQQNSRILILSIYSLSNIYQYLLYKYSEYLKLSVEASTPWWGRSVVWHTSSEFRTTALQMAALYSINTEVPALGNSLSWDTNQCVCDITTVHDCPLLPLWL